jgi:hypothetical protein
MTAAAVDNKGYSDYAFPETLDASGNTTSWVTCENFKDHTVSFTMPAHTSVVVKAEGSLNGTTFFTLDPSGNADAAAVGNITFSAAGTYALIIRNARINYIRLNLVSYGGGVTAAGITPIRYRGG